MRLDDGDSLTADDQLGTVLAACLETGDRGEADLQTWVSRYPEFVAELTDLFEGQTQVERLAAQLRTVVQAAQMPTPAAATTLRAFDLPCRFGDYELLEEVGRGGMGVVYRARQMSLVRLVAIKMVRAGHLASAEERQRFRVETDATASLDHPNIVPIYDVGTRDGQPYYCMKLISGGNLTEHLARYETDPRAAAELIATTARAVHHAHQHGILHRDLKPSNILLDAEGRPHLVDFGLAKRSEAETNLTLSGVLVGTPSYMAPELALGRKGAVSTATDVYGLGAVFYALLTGKPPFRSETILQTLEDVRERSPDPPSGSNQRVDRDLETICLKCLEKEPGKRYGSAEALAQDLERWLAGKPIVARPLNHAARTWRWCRRNPVVAGMSGIIVLLLAAGVVALAVGYVLVGQQREIAEAKSQEADRQRKLALDNLRSIIADINDLENRRPELDDLRQDLLIRVQTYLSAILDDPAHAVQADETDFWLEIHVGDIYRDDANQLSSARVHYQQALAITERMEGDANAERLRRRLRSFALSRLGDIHRMEGEESSALEHYREMLGVREELFAAQPDRQARADLAVAHIRIGDGYAFSAHPDRLAKTGEHYQKSYELYRALVQEFPDDIEYARMLGHASDRLLDFRRACWELDRAITVGLANLDYRRNAGGRFPGCELAFEVDRILTLDRLSRIYSDAGQFGRAREMAEEILAFCSDLLRRNPRSTRFKFSMGLAYALLGTAWQGEGRFDLALANFDKQYALFKELKAAAPTWHEPIPVLDCLIDASGFDARSDDRHVRYSEERISALRRQYASGSLRPVECKALFQNLQILGDYHLLRRRYAEAERLYQDARQLHEEARNVSWTVDEREALAKRLELPKRANRNDFEPASELVGLATDRPCMLLMQNEFHARRDHARLAQVSEQLAGLDDGFALRYEAARGFAHAAQLGPPPDVQEKYDRRCQQLIARLIRFGGHVKERLRTDPAFQRYASSLVSDGTP
jgi:tRNA A-37 threonylcarbamoyl transferase component Bud32/tetratricopeptide (TPR) repeat protein